MAALELVHFVSLLAWVITIALLPRCTSYCQSRLLDDFESLEGRRSIVSEGARLTLLNGEGKKGRALVMDFDLSRVSGYVIAQKDFALDLPADYQFTFDMRADALVNSCEFKLIDEQGNLFWIKKFNIHYPSRRAVKWSFGNYRQKSILAIKGPG